ncbi:MAG: two-component system response regulator AtoC [Bradymonadia bacterium]|jgi:two-component system response regulator AtoC
MLLRAVVAVDPAPLADAIVAHLKAADVVVETASATAGVWPRLAGETIDLLFVSAARLPAQWEDALNTVLTLPERPVVGVFVQQADAAQRARLLSAGCELVLESGLDIAQVNDVLTAVIARRRARAPRGAIVQPSLSDFVSRSPTMQAFMHIVRRVARSRTSLLIEGETGVGKERLARALHTDSPRGTSPFVAVNCGALPESLLESELFGHEKGAFTGATRSRRGCFELADGGTLFLDEIGEIPFHLQVKLLRALQEREIQRVGGEHAFAVDVRVIAATNRDLTAEIAAGRFRSDLFYRLNVVTLHIPPLRARVEDIPDLVRSYIDHLAAQIGTDVEAIDPAALDALCAYGWPGNIRELINVIERSLLLCEGTRITRAHLPDNLGGLPLSAPAVVLPMIESVESATPTIDPALLALSLPDARRRVVDAFERAYLSALLTEVKGRVGEVARRAGIQPRSLYDRMQRLGLDKRGFRDPDD